MPDAAIPQPAREMSVTYAVSAGARLESRHYRLTDDERHHIEHALLGLMELGHIAAYAIEEPDATGGTDEFLDDLRQAVGRIAADAVFAAGSMAHAADLRHPEMLITAWDFDDAAEGGLAAAGCCCGLDLDVRAVRSDQEEVGTQLPGRDGYWLLSAASHF